MNNIEELTEEQARKMSEEGKVAFLQLITVFYFRNDWQNQRGMYVAGFVGRPKIEEFLEELRTRCMNVHQETRFYVRGYKDQEHFSTFTHSNKEYVVDRHTLQRE